MKDIKDKFIQVKTWQPRRITLSWVNPANSITMTYNGRMFIMDSERQLVINGDWILCVSPVENMVFLRKGIPFEDRLVLANDIRGKIEPDDDGLYRSKIPDLSQSFAQLTSMSTNKDSIYFIMFNKLCQDDFKARYGMGPLNVMLVKFHDGMNPSQYV